MPSHKTDINVGIKFSADTSQAKQQIQQLSYDLNKIASMKTNSLMPPAEIEKIKQATQAAKELQIHLSKAFNPTTNTLNLVDFNKSLQSTGSNISALSNKLMGAGATGRQAFVSLAQSIASANQPMLKTNALLGQMWTTLKNTARWQISSSILQGFIGSVQKATSYVKDLDKSLTDIRIVTGYNADYMADFAKEANKAAKALNTTTNEYAKASLIYFQQGLSDQQVKERTDVTVKMANVTRDSAQVVSDQMTAIWNNFDDGSKSLEYYADVITALGAATASSTDEIAQGLEKFAAVASTVGLSYEYATSALATITAETRQSADVVGTALKTLFARIQGLSLGETLDDGTNLNKYSEALAKVGISIKEQNGELKDMDNILDEMAAKWDTLNKDQQVALAQTVAGVRQYTQLVALMDNWDAMQTNLGTAANSEGTLQEQQDIYAESWEAASKRAKAALESIYSTILDRDFFIKLTNSFADVAEGLDKFFKSIDGLKGILQGLSLFLIASFSKNIPQAISNFSSNVQYAFLGASSQAKKAASDMQQAFTNVNKNDFTELQNFQLEKASYLITLRQRAAEMAKHQTDAEKLQSQIAVQGFEQQVNSIETLIARRNELNSSLYSIANNSIYEYAETKSGGPWDDGFFNSEFFRTNEDAIQRLINKYQDLKAAKDSATKINGSEIFQQNIASVNSLSQAVQNQELTIEEAKAQLLAYAEFLKEKFGISFDKAALNSDNLSTAVQEVTKGMADFAPKAKTVGNILRDSFNLSTAEANRNMGTTIGLISNYKEQLLGLNGTFEETYVSINRTVTGFEMLSKSFGTVYSLSMVFQTLGNTWKAIQDPDTSGWDAILKTFTSLGFAIPMAMNAFKSFKDYLPTKVLDKESFLKSNKYKDKYVSQYFGGKTRENIERLDLSNLTKEEQDIYNNPNNYNNKSTNHYLKTEYQTELQNIDAKKQKAHEQQKYDKYVKSTSIKSVLAYGAALAGIAFVFALIIKQYKKQQELKPEAQLKRATENADKLREAADKAESSLKGLRETLESYDKGVEELNKLAVGTEKFSEKLKAANEDALELINTYGIVDGININEKTGAIEISEAARKKAIENHQQQLDIANLNAINAENVKRRANERVEWQKIKGSYGIITASELSQQQENLKNPSTTSSKAGAGSWAYNQAEEKAVTKDLSEIVTEEFLLKLETKTGDARNNLLSNELYQKNYNDLDSSQKRYINTLNENSKEFKKYTDLVKENNKANEVALKLQLHQNALNNEDYAESEYQNEINQKQLDNYDKLYQEKLIEAKNNSDKEYLLQEIVKANDKDTYARYEKAENGNYNIFDKDGNTVLVLNGGNEEIFEAYASTKANAEIENYLEDTITFIEKNMSTLKTPGEQKVYSGLISGDVTAGGVEAGYWWNKADDPQKQNLINNIKYKDSSVIENLKEENKLNTDEEIIDFLNKQYSQYNNPYQDFQKKLEKAGITLDNEWEKWYSELNDEERAILAEIEIDEEASQDNLEKTIKQLQKENKIILAIDNSFTEGMSSTMEAIQEADKVLGNYKENGELSYSDVSGLIENFSDVENYQLYIDMMTAEGATAQEVEQALESLVTEKINLLAATEDFSKKDLEAIDLWLKEAGVVNHTEMAHNLYGKALLNNITNLEELTDLEKEYINTIIKNNSKKPFDIFKEAEKFAQVYSNTLQKTANTTENFDSASKEATKTLYDQIEAFFEETGASDLAKIAMFELIAQLTIFNNTNLNVEQKIQALADLADQAAITGMYIDGIFQGDKALAYGTAVEIGERHGFDEGEIQDLIREYEGDYEKVVEAIMKKNLMSGDEVEDNGQGANLNGPEDKDKSESSAEPLEYEDEIERYHENTRAIERLSRALDKVSTAKDRAFGKHRLALIDDEIEATEKLVAQQRALLHETREYLKQDFAEIQQYGFTYDEFGELTNYDEVMKAQIDKYNAVVATGNADAIEAAKKEYDEFKENMEQYEETLTQYEEAQAQLQEYINQVVDLKLEKITTEVEIKILVNDKELTRLEYLLRKIEYEGKGAADAIALMGRQFEQISEKAKPIQEAIDKIYEQARAEGRGLLEEEVKEIKSFYQDGVISSEEEKRIKEIYDKAASEDRMLTQAEEEQIQEYKEQLLELNQEVMDIVETIEGKFMETLEELNGKVDESIGRFATYTGMFQTLSDVITLSGKAGSKYGMDMLNTLSARTVANASTAMRSNLRSYEALGQIYEEEQANLERAIKTGDERLIKQYQDRLHEVEMMRETSYESMLTSWTEALQAANDLFDTKLTNMITSLKQNLGDIDKLVEIYDRAVELEDLYISGNKSIYELSKLARDVGKDIDKTANIIAKNKLVNLLDQINKMRAEGVKLSQYDLEYWQAKYELELAEIALQEAQEAKAQVKLTRNTAGGWGYTYVADAEAISEAQQNYEDSLYNMQELHDEYIRDYSERLIKNRQDLVNALQDLDKTSLTFEEDALRLKEHHFKQEEYLIDELNKAYQRAGVSYQDTLLAQTYGGASLEDSHTNFINSVVKMIQDELLPGYQEFQESVDDINGQAGTTVEDAMDKIFESSMTMEDEVIKNINDLTSGVKEVSDEIWNFQETYGEAISKMLQDNEDYYSKTIKMYQNFMDETEADKWLQYFDDMRGPGEVLGLAGSGATGAMAGNGSTAITNSAFGSILQQSTKGKSNSSSSKSYSNDDNDDELIAAAKEAAEKAGKDYYVYEKGGVATIAPLSPGGNLLTSDLYTKDGQTLQTVNDDGTLNLSKGPLTDAQEELRGHNDGKGYVYDPKTQKFVKPDELATGGYTGSWGSEGRLAILHEKELVLNKYDTENMLDMINTLRDIDWRAKLSELWTNIEEHFITPIFGGGDNLQQDVRIEASFPGVSNHTEIEEAFNNLINTASQYANRKRY